MSCIYRTDNVKNFRSQILLKIVVNKMVYFQKVLNDYLLSCLCVILMIKNYLRIFLKIAMKFITNLAYFYSLESNDVKK